MEAEEREVRSAGEVARRGRRAYAGVRPGLELSPFRILVYRQCPRKYRYIYHDGIWGEYKKPRPDLSLSNSLHLALRGLYRIGGPSRHPVAKLLQLFDESWIPKGYHDQDEERRCLDLGRKALARFHEAECRCPVRSLFAERTLRTPLNGYRIFAKIDRLDLLDGGGHEVVFYRTGPNCIVGDDEEERVCLPIYELLVREHYGSDRVKLTVWDLLEGQRRSRFGDPDELAAFRDELKSVARTIAAAQEYPEQENRFCNWCDFVELCGHHQPGPGPASLEALQS